MKRRNFRELGKSALDRRTFLKGLGAATGALIAIPPVHRPQPRMP